MTSLSSPITAVTDIVRAFHSIGIEDSFSSYCRFWFYTGDKPAHQIKDSDLTEYAFERLNMGHLISPNALQSILTKSLQNPEARETSWEIDPAQCVYVDDIVIPSLGKTVRNGHKVSHWLELCEKIMKGYAVISS